MPIRDNTPPPSEEEKQAGLAFMRTANPHHNVELMEGPYNFWPGSKDSCYCNGWVYRPSELPESAHVKVNQHGGFILTPKA